MDRALKAGVRCPLFALLPDIRFENVELVTLLGALEGFYVVSTHSNREMSTLEKSKIIVPRSRKLKLEPFENSYFETNRKYISS